MRRRLPSVAALLVSLGFLAGCSEPPPDLLLITVDTLRADGMGATRDGARLTPHMDDLAAAGVRFTDVTTPMPRTTQALASIFCSRYPAEHGVVEIGQALGPGPTTLAEVLRESGYRTVAVSANPVAGPLQGLDRGFSHFVDRATLEQRYGLRFNLEGPNLAGMGPAEAVTHEALRAVAQAGDEPLFLWLLYMDPHWPYNPPAPYNQVVDWSQFRFYAELRRTAPVRANLHFNLNGKSARYRDDVRSLYRAELGYTDAMIGRLLEGLRARPRPRLVVLTADHGESLGENGYFYQHGALVDEACLRVPLVFSWPGQLPSGLTVHTPVSLVDVGPTILKTLGLPAPPDFRGRDLGPAWRDGAGLAERAVSAESGTIVYPQNPLRELGGRESAGLRFIREGRWAAVAEHGEHRLYDVIEDPALERDRRSEHAALAARLSARLEALPRGADRWRALRRGPWKLQRIPAADGVHWRLFKLDEDPFETRDLAPEHPELVAAMQRELDAIPSVADSLAASPAELAPEVAEQLEALGYLHGE